MNVDLSGFTVQSVLTAEWFWQASLARVESTLRSHVLTLFPRKTSATFSRRRYKVGEVGPKAVPSPNKQSS